MFTEFVDVLVLIVRSALFAGLCWGAWLCLGGQLEPRDKRRHDLPLERFATFAAVLLLLSAAGNLFQGG